MNVSARRMLSLVLMAVMLAVMTAPASAARTTTLGGVVTDIDSGAPIAGAIVVATGTGGQGTFTATTDAAGRYSMAMTGGTFNITCTAAGYSPYTRTGFAVKSGRANTLDIKLVSIKGALTGVVTDLDTGMPLDGAMVTASPGGSVTTDGAGRYLLSDVPGGEVTVLAAKSGYVDFASGPVVITGGQTTTYDIAMTSSVSGGVSITALTADPQRLAEESTSTVTLTATLTGTAAAYQWTQLAGPKVTLSALSSTEATADVSTLSVAVDTELVFQLSVTGSDSVTTERTVSVFIQPVDLHPFLGENVQVGGSSTAVETFSFEGATWTLFNIGSQLVATPVSITAGERYSAYAPGAIADIDVVAYGTARYALLSCGTAGIVVADITDPRAITLRPAVRINYRKDDITFTEGGGAILYGNVIESVTAPVSGLATDGVTLWIADHGFGIHRTSLESLLGVTGPVLEADGTLAIEAECYTLQYAGENAWGGPMGITLIDDRLFVPMGALGIGIFDATTLAQVGRYNLYTDASVTEDWFCDMDVATQVATDPVTSQPFIDAFTGMPDYRQTSFEITQVMKNDAVAPTPWADFDRYGKFYYNAQGVDVVDWGTRQIAYIAYSLGGMVAVDVTGYETATPEEFLTGTYLGYTPAVPANGPDEPTGEESRSLLPYFGAGMLKESGVVDVKVAEGKVFLSEHFGGLMVIADAATPETWHGAAAPYDNDTDDILGNHWPDSEFITSFDMTAWDPTDNESMPVWMYEYPCLLVTTEVNGHGNSILLSESMDLTSAGQVDLLQCAGAGGFNFLDIVDLEAGVMEDRFAVPAYFPSTDEIGAAPDGSATQTMAIGHAQGIASSDDYVYVADGPHGVSAWQITDADGFATDDVHVVGNTLQDEYPITVGTTTVYPASHATNVVFDDATDTVWSGSASLGLRRVKVDAIEGGLGSVGSPALLPLTLKDCFEHNASWGTVKGLQYQDHAYDVVIKGRFAYTADGSNGITVYDTTKDPTNPKGGFVVGNVGAGMLQPPLGTASGITLWTDPATARVYAFVACGPRGVGVVDVTDVRNMYLVKVFEPIKLEDGKVGAADGQATDVLVVGDYAYFSYDSFGVVCYSLADLIEPLPAGVSPTETWKKSLTGQLLYDYRPAETGRFKLQWVPGYEDVDGGAFKADYTLVDGKLVFYVAFGEAGLAKIGWDDPVAPQLLALAPTAGECTAVTISQGRVYVADHGGGLVFFK